MDILSITKVWDDGYHNGFTDLYYWAGRFFLAFRSAASRGSEEAHIRILHSTDTVAWDAVAALTAPGDPRDPKFVSIGEKLLLFANVLPRREGDNSRAYVSVTEDGSSWPAMAPSGPKGLRFWRPRIHGQSCYVSAYEGSADIAIDERRSVLLESHDGTDWREISTIYRGDGAAETELWFERDDRVTAIVRREKTPGFPVVATAKPPYLAWKHRPSNRLLESPMMRKVYRRYLVSGRIHDQSGRPQTAVLWLKNNKLVLDTLLPSGGDTSYPGCCWLNEDEVLLSYHSSHEYSIEPEADVPAAIYVARLGLDF